MLGELLENLIISEKLQDIMRLLLELHRVYYKISALVVIFILAHECKMHNDSVSSNMTSSKDESL